MTEFSLVPRTMDEAIKYSEMIAVSSFCPKDFKGRPGDVLVAIQYGAELGIMPLQALQGIAVIQGRPCVWGDLALAIVRGSGLVEDFTETDPAEALKVGKATCTAKRKGQATPISRTFSIEDAKKAGLWGKQGPWTQYPGRMLTMRARAWTIRDGFADVLRGLQLREEVQDIPLDVQATVVPTQTVAPKVNVGKIASEVRASEAKRIEAAPQPARPAITVQMDPTDDYGEPPDARQPGDEPPEEGMPEDLARFLKAIAAATSLPMLALVGAEIAQSGMEDGLKADARKAYMARQAQLKKGAG